MVGHYSIAIQFHLGKMEGNLQPALLDKSSRLIQLNLTVHYLPEQTGPVMCADGHEIRPQLRIIISLQTDGSPMNLLLIVGCEHFSFMTSI
jgi:hypothetical protein